MLGISSVASHWFRHRKLSSRRRQRLPPSGVYLEAKCRSSSVRFWHVSLMSAILCRRLRNPGRTSGYWESGAWYGVILCKKKQQSMRRASGFNHLYKFLSVKEQNPLAETEFTQTITPSLYPQHNLTADNIPLPDITSQTKKGKCVAGWRDVGKRVWQDAIADVKWMSNMASLKWTWGADLDPTELRNLCQLADAGNQLPHSGYDTSLMMG